MKSGLTGTFKFCALEAELFLIKLLRKFYREKDVCL